MVSTHCHFLQKAAWGRARASSYCTYSFFIVARYAIPVARYAIPVARDANRVARDAISVSREGGNLLLSGTVCLHIVISFFFFHCLRNVSKKDPFVLPNKNSQKPCHQWSG